MDIIITREALLKPLQAVSGVVEKKQTLPILSNVLLTTKANTLLLTGTDHEIELVGFVPIVTSNVEGRTTVSARKLFDICRTLPEGTHLSLSVENNYLGVRAGESRFMLNTLPAEDFPSLEESIYPATFSLKQSQLKNLLVKTYFAMAQQDVRPYLNGTFLDIGPNAIKCVTADGHRLALTALENENIGKVEARVILPRKSVLELIRLLSGENDQEVTIHIGDSRLKMVTVDFTFTTKLITAQYPDYRRLIPRGTMAAQGEREMIKQALTRASILCNEKFRGVRFQLEPNKLRITANNSDQEHAEEAIPLEYEGETMEICFNITYLLDAISAISTKIIRCCFTDPNSGVLIESTEGDKTLYVIMPMRL